MTQPPQEPDPRGPSALIVRLRAWRDRGRQPDAVGQGLWRRAHDDCATAARRSPALEDLMPAVRALAEQGQRRWPSETLDVPAAADGRAHYEHLRSVQQAFRDVAYRTRLTALDGADPRQELLLESALADARRLMDDPAPGNPATDDPA